MGMKGKIALGAVVGIVVIGAVSANAGNDSGGDSSSSSSGKGSSASADRGTDGKTKSDAEDVAEKKVAFAGDGDFQVGSDIKPGTYRTTGNSDGMCYWERAKDASGEMESLLANENVMGTSYVTVKGTDKLFTSSDCNDWEAVDEKAKGSPASKMSGDAGMLRVGVDIAPGTYKSTGNTDDACYWERTKNADHSIESIIANNNVSGTAVVTIAASDAYFKTSGCQDWKKSA
ncbi:hypothetical protein BN159_5175 [Streptomyces davaonensis JCM 4913]|uniref:Secreted protein n=1 Tax=Streptomyces davaonensis (strain DSM 101723 / JCM 4913 / KCC S-0913 / 768) TaxID=1214101 RepID=K4RA28_STRDJ|nr:hypothetical protein [Streptomyces davaonensis]CCK29554.1 hypothetical protein BN159_5175 [Streptomyces davaonensis JCM 4913]